MNALLLVILRNTEPALQLIASPNVAQRIAHPNGEQPRSITVRLVGGKDVQKLVSGINQAQESALKQTMALD